MGKAAVQDGLLGGIWPTGGNILDILNARVIFSWFYFPSHPTQDWVDQGCTQGSGTGDDSVLPDKGDYRGYRDCYVPTLVTTEEGGFHVRSVGTGIASYITRIRSRIIMGY